MLEKLVGRGWCLLTCRRLLRNTRGPSLSLKRYLEAETVHEKLKLIQPRTEGERKREQRLRDPNPAAPGESSPLAFKDTQQAQEVGAVGALGGDMQSLGGSAKESWEASLVGMQAAAVGREAKRSLSWQGAQKPDLSLFLPAKTPRWIWTTSWD